MGNNQEFVMKKYEEVKIEVIDIDHDIIRTSQEQKESKDFTE